MCRRVVFAFLLAFAVFAIAAPRVHAEAQANIFPLFPPRVTMYGSSTIGAGMGGAGAAAFWDPDADHAINPALLAYGTGVHYEAADVLLFGESDRLRLEELRIGAGGIGLAFAGQPFHGRGRREIDDSFDFTDISGSLVQTIVYRERMRSWGVGASAGRLLGSLASLGRFELPAIARHVDVAAGYAEHTVTAGQTDFPAPRGFGSAFGLLASAGTTFTHHGVPAKLEGAYGYSSRFGGDRWIGGVPLLRQVRHAFAVHATMAPPQGWAPRASDWPASALDPFVSIALAYDAEHATMPSSWRGPFGYGYDLHHYGAEVALTRVLAVRVGHFESADHYVATTWGLSLTAPFGRYGAVRWSHADVPWDGGDIDPQKYSSWSAWVDPLALVRAMR